MRPFRRIPGSNGHAIAFTRDALPQLEALLDQACYVETTAPTLHDIQRHWQHRQRHGWEVRIDLGRWEKTPSGYRERLVALAAGQRWRAILPQSVYR